MKTEFGNIWDYYDKGYIVIIPSNIGWKSNGENVMGRGIAKQASIRFPDLPKRYGKICKEKLENAAFWHWKDHNLICLATKSLNRSAPALSWKQNSTIEQIEASLQLFTKWLDEHLKKDNKILIAMPLLGCGNGQLREDLVLPIMKKYLDKYECIILVKFKTI